MSRTAGCPTVLWYLGKVKIQEPDAASPEHLWHDTLTGEVHGDTTSLDTSA